MELQIGPSVVSGLVVGAVLSTGRGRGPACPGGAVRRRRGPVQLALLGAAAGAAGTTALNTVTYLDMAVRGRPSSSTPEDTVEALSDRAHIPLPGEGEAHDNRVAGLGPLTGIAAGVGVGALLGVARGWGWRPGVLASTATATLGALLGSNGPMTVLGVTDPRTWPASAWAADVVPHLAYGAVTAAVLDRLDDRSPRWRVRG